MAEEQKKTKQEILNEGVAKLTGLCERVRYKPGDLPSQVNGELHNISAAMNTELALIKEKPPSSWDDLIGNVKLFLAEAAKPRRSGSVEHLQSIIAQGGAQLIADEQNRIATDGLIAEGKAVKRAEWDRLSQAERTNLSGAIRKRELVIVD